MQAAIESYDKEVAIERAQFFEAANRGRPLSNGQLGRAIELSYQGNEYRLVVAKQSSNHYLVAVGDHSLQIEIRPFAFQRHLIVGGKRYKVNSVDHGLTQLVEVDGVPHKISKDKGGVLRAPAPGIVVSIAVEEGEEVTAGQTLMVLEAMKMEMGVEAPFDGIVRSVKVINNLQLQTGTPLIQLEPKGDGKASQAPLLSFAAFSTPESVATESYSPYLRQVTGMMLGFDANEDLAFPQWAQDLPEQAQRQRLALEDRILQIFVDFTVLLRRRHHQHVDIEEFTSEEYLFSYLRDLSSKGENLPESFRDKLQAALSHFSVSGLEKTPELQEALFRIFKSQQRTKEQTAPILKILQSRLEHVDQIAYPDQDNWRQLLESLLEACRGRYQSIHDLALSHPYVQLSSHADILAKIGFTDHWKVARHVASPLTR